jgi:hypothetical protein
VHGLLILISAIFFLVVRASYFVLVFQVHSLLLGQFDVESGFFAKDGVYSVLN